MRDRSATRFIAITLIVLCALALVVGLVNVAPVRKAQSATTEDSEEGSPSVTGMIVKGALKKDHLLLVDLSGPISMEAPQGGIWPEDSNAMTVRKTLDKAAEDPSIKGVLLRINSPGGTVAMSQELNAAVKRVRAEKPVVVSMGDLTASGGYYTACAADHIFAEPGTLTASIGVIISSMNWKHLAEDKLGVTSVTIKSGKFKDLLNPFRTPTAEDIALVQNLINESYQDFIDAVLDGRLRALHPKTDAEKQAWTEKIRAVADGRIVPGRMALQVGLIDSIGDMHAAKEKLTAMAQARFHLRPDKEIPLETYNESGLLMQLFGLDALANHLNQMARQTTTNPLAQMMPMSARFPNQPLWVYE